MTRQRRTHTKRKFFIPRIILCVVLTLLVGGIWYSHSIGSGTKADSATNSSSTETSATTEKAAKIKQELTNYLNEVTEDGTVNVSFYNLSPVAGSSAAKADDAAVYKEGNLAVSVNGDKSHVAASTYKLFISAFLFHEDSIGSFKWTSSNSDGFKRMIVNSENDFAEEELSTFGLSTINNFIKNQGWSSPVFVQDEDANTTANSLKDLLLSLENGTGAFSDESNRAKLLNYMSKQEYRTGIPTGASDAKSGTTVQDKVGFLNDTNNDAGIVTLPNGQKYILVIMTNGHSQSGLSGFPRIAKITKNIQKIVYGD